jgi:hypothetical protein
VLAILAMLARRLRVAPGGSAPPIPCVARRGHGGARSRRESRLSDRTGKRLLQSYAYHRRDKRSSRVNDDRSVCHSLCGAGIRAVGEEMSWTAVARFLSKVG